MIKMRVLLGQQGVAKSESRLAQIVGRIFFALTLPLILILGVDLHDAHLFGRGYILSFFIINAVVLGCLVRNKALYFKTNWASLVIIAMGLPIVLAHSYFDVLPANFFQSFSHYFLIVLILGLLLPWLDVCISSLAKGHIAGIFLMNIMLITLGGIFAFSFNLNPAHDVIKNVGDGMWWAFSTATVLADVKVGDLPAARLLAVFLVLGGLSLFSIFTANLTAYLTKERFKSLSKKELREEASLAFLILQNDKILAELKDLRKRR